MENEELKKRIAKYINKTVSYSYGDGFVQIDYTSPDGVEHIYIEEDIDDFTFIDFLEDYTLDILQQEIDRVREEQNKKIEDVINEELKQGNIVILKKSKWFKKLSKLKNKSNG